MLAYFRSLRNILWMLSPLPECQQGFNVKKCFHHNWCCCKKTRAFVPETFFQADLMFASKVRANPLTRNHKVQSFGSLLHYSQTLDQLEKIMPGTSVLAFLKQRQCWWKSFFNNDTRPVKAAPCTSCSPASLHAFPYWLLSIREALLKGKGQYGWPLCTN